MLDACIKANGGCRSKGIDQLSYFDTIARARTLKLLHHLLLPHGLLFVGHAETALLSAAQFTPVRHPFAFAYRKVNPAQTSRPNSHQNSPQSPHPKRSSCHPTLHQRVGNSSTGGQSVRNQIVGHQSGKKLATDRHFSAPLNSTDSLHQAKNLANQGQLEAAIHECQTGCMSLLPSPFSGMPGLL